jgi:hypothetical protein
MRLWSALAVLLAATPALAGLVNPRTSTELFWPEGVVPYEIRADHAHPEYIAAAIEEFRKKTAAVRFVPRTHEPDYLVFANAPDDGAQCSWQGSTYKWGRSPGKQVMALSSTCVISNYATSCAICWVSGTSSSAPIRTSTSSSTTRTSWMAMRGISSRRRRPKRSGRMI